VSSHWQKAKTEANKQEPTTKPENANSLTTCEFVLKMPAFVGVSEDGGKDSLPPSHKSQ
jgi:hypothetical protein